MERMSLTGSVSWSASSPACGRKWRSSGKDFTWHGTGRLAASGGLASFEISASVHGLWAEGFDVYGETGHLRVRSFFPFFRRASEVTVFTEHDSVAPEPVLRRHRPLRAPARGFCPLCPGRRAHRPGRA